MQKAYIKALYDLIEKDKNVISCLSDSGTDYDEMIAREFPNQVINFGISENNKVAVAAGMASFNKIPFVYTTGAFLAYRSYEFIRVDVCLQNKNVKLIGMGCGLSWSTLGPTHHTTEDIGILKTLPNLTLFSPATPNELKKCMYEAYKIKGPVYIRIGMSNEKELYNDEDIDIYKNNIICKGNDGIIFTTGSITNDALLAIEELKKENINFKLVDICTIKPLNEENIIKESKKYKTIFSIEEHNINGGLGSSIADVIAKYKLNKKLVKIGLDDKFGIGYGTHEEVKIQNNLDFNSIYKKIKENL